MTTTFNYEAWGSSTFNLILTSPPNIRTPEDLTPYVEDQLYGGEEIVNKTDRGDFYAWEVTNNDTGVTVSTRDLADELEAGYSYTIRAIYR